MAVDKTGVNFLDFLQERLALKSSVFCGKEMAFVNLALFNHGAAFSYFSVLPCDFLFRAYSLSCFVKEYAAAGNLNLWLGKQLSLAENEMDMIVCLSLIMVQSRHTFHSVPSAKFLCKIL